MTSSSSSVQAFCQRPREPIHSRSTYLKRLTLRSGPSTLDGCCWSHGCLAYKRAARADSLAARLSRAAHSRSAGCTVCVRPASTSMPVGTPQALPRLQTKGEIEIRGRLCSKQYAVRC